MKTLKYLCAAAALLLLVSGCIVAQANTPSLPLVLPDELTISLDNVCLTLDSLLHRPDADEIARDYTDALLEQYNGVMIQAAGSVNLWDSPNNEHPICAVSSGSVLRLLGVKDGWYKVSVDDAIGYFRTQYAVPVTYDETETDTQEENSSATDTTPVPPAPINVNENLVGVSDVRQSLVDSAMSWIGVPYCYGGCSTGGTDCSGFTMSIFSQFGYNLIHGAGDQYLQSTPVTTEERTVGDLVFFNWGYGISHVGIYLGDGCFIHASTSSGVKIDSLYTDYYANGYIGAGRILPD